MRGSPGGRKWESLMIEISYHTWNVSWTLSLPDVVKVTDAFIVVVTIIVSV